MSGGYCNDLSGRDQCLTIVGLVRARYQQLNERYGYFQSEANAETFSALFTRLVMTCRKITVLIERNNSPEDEKPYLDAYKLMALFIDEQQTPPSFDSLARRIDNLMTPTDKQLVQSSKPYN